MTLFWVFYIGLIGALALSVIAQIWALAVQLFVLFIVVSAGLMIAKSMRKSVTENSQDYENWHQYK